MKTIRPMTPTDKDFDNLDMHGLTIEWNEFMPGLYEATIDLPDVKITVERRNFYCDRGRYGFWATSKSPEKICIDYADGFPRYFFSLQRALDEMYDWIVFRNLNKAQNETDGENQRTSKETQSTC